jgi:hypothetical protein
MARSLAWSLPLFSAGLLAMLLIGCEKKDAAAPDSSPATAESHDDHEHGDEHAAHEHGHDHGSHAIPDNYAAAVDMLKEHYEEIKTAFAADDADQAHDPLHCVGDLLEALPKLATAAQLTPEQTEAVQGAVDKMLDAYGTVDEALHHGEKADYAAVSQTVDEQMQVLEGLKAKP